MVKFLKPYLAVFFKVLPYLAKFFIRAYLDRRVDNKMFFQSIKIALALLNLAGLTSGQL